MNVFVQVLKYTDLEEVRQSGKMRSISDNDVIILLGKSENIIDNIISKSFESTPIAIKQAVILLAERLSTYTESEKIVTSEKRRGNAVTYESKSNPYARYYPCMNADIYSLLSPFIQNNFFRT